MEDLHAPGHRAEVELDSVITRRDRERRASLVGHEYDLDEEWRKLEAEHRQDRRATVADLWQRYHRCQANRLRDTLGVLVQHHESEAKRWEGE